MLDKTMCSNEKCPSKEDCLRFMFKPSIDRYWVTKFKPVKSKDHKIDRCDMFVELKLKK